VGASALRFKINAIDKIISLRIQSLKPKGSGVYQHHVRLLQLVKTQVSVAYINNT